MKKIESAAKKFVDSLDPDQREDAILPWESESRGEWHYIPRWRSGLELKKMDADQKEHARALMQAALSEVGFDKVRGILLLEQILRETEPWYSLIFFPRNPENFVFCFFGSPHEDKPWGWRMEGHHLSLNFTVVPGRGISFTPAFYGASPAVVGSNHPRAGMRVLEREHSLGFQLVRSLNAEQLAIARIDEDSPGDILAGPGEENRFHNQRDGLAIGALNPEQRRIALELIQEYLFNIGEDFARKQMERARKAGIENIRFVWAGSLNPERPHYYRLHGPTMVIEYDNTQDNANHVHSVWHDPANHLGQDLLRDHYRAHHH
ncbi:MAG: DUF3500 domain-containing protein [Leptospirales bacterium]